jgi:hypothetical protein
MPPLHWHDLSFRPRSAPMSLCVADCAPFGLFLPVGCCSPFFCPSVSPWALYVYRPAAVRRGSVRHLGYIRPWGAVPNAISVLSVCLPAMARPGPLWSTDIAQNKSSASVCTWSSVPHFFSMTSCINFSSCAAIAACRARASASASAAP